MREHEESRENWAPAPAKQEARVRPTPLAVLFAFSEKQGGCEYTSERERLGMKRQAVRKNFLAFLCPLLSLALVLGQGKEIYRFKLRSSPDQVLEAGIKIRK